MISKHEFKQKFEEGFAKERKRYQKHLTFSYIWLAVSAIIVVGAAIGLHFGFDRGGKNNVLLIIGSIIGWFALAGLPIISSRDKNLRAFKTFGLKKVLSLIYGENVNYLSSGFVPQVLFNQSGFCDKDFNEYGGEDLFAFDLHRTIKNEDVTTSFLASDVIAKQCHKTKDEHNDKVVFDAAVCCVKFRKPFACELELNTPKKLNLLPLETESVEFNKLYKAQTSNQIEARLILSLPLMQKLIELRDKANCKVGFSFRGEYMFIYLKKNLFGLSKKDDHLDFKLVEPIYDDLAILEDIANEIESNRKIFKI